MCWVPSSVLLSFRQAPTGAILSSNSNKHTDPWWKAPSSSSLSSFTFEWIHYVANAHSSYSWISLADSFFKFYNRPVLLSAKWHSQHSRLSTSLIFPSSQNYLKSKHKFNHYMSTTSTLFTINDDWFYETIVSFFSSIYTTQQHSSWFTKFQQDTSKSSSNFGDALPLDLPLFGWESSCRSFRHCFQTSSWEPLLSSLLTPFSDCTLTITSTAEGKSWRRNIIPLLITDLNGSASIFRTSPYRTVYKRRISLLLHLQPPTSIPLIRFSANISPLVLQKTCIRQIHCQASLLFFLSFGLRYPSIYTSSAFP